MQFIWYKAKTMQFWTREEESKSKTLDNQSKLCNSKQKKKEGEKEKKSMQLIKTIKFFRNKRGKKWKRKDKQAAEKEQAAD